MLQPVEPFGPPAESQFQPLLPTSSINCVPNTTRKLIRRATCDAKAPSTASIRTASGAPSTRGLTYNEAAEAAWDVSKVKLIPSFGNERDEMHDIVDGGHACGLSGDCSVTVGGERATGSFTGNHTVYVHDTRHVVQGGTCKCEKQSAARAHNEYLIEDPGNSAKGYQWWSAKLAYEFGEKRTERQGRTAGINLLVAPDTEGVTRKAVMTGSVRAAPRKDAARFATVTVGKAYTVKNTVTGGAWQRKDGTTAHGWHRIPRTGPDGYIRGEALGVAA